jgi:hypothetical protein
MYNDSIDIVDNNYVNRIATDITDVLTESAKATFVKSVSNKEVYKSSIRNCNKEWHNGDCYKPKRDLRKSQRLYKHYGSIIFKERLRQSEIHYKRVMDDTIFRYICEMSIKMKELKTKNPKEFWKLFNGRKIVDNSNISFGTLFDFFKDLSKNKIEDNFIIENDINSDKIKE